MAKYEIVEELQMRPRGGFGGIGGFNKDDSAELEDMNYAEKLVLSEEFLTALSKLGVAKVEGNKIHGGVILLTKDDIVGYEGEMNGAAHQLNKVFVSLEIPFYATSYATEDAEKTTRVGKRGKKVGISYKVTLPDRLRVYRISEDFEVDRYACDASVKVISEGINNYHEPTEGMRAREAKWILENGAELIDTLEAIGVDVSPQ